MAGDDAWAADDPVTVDVEWTGDRTVISVTGTRELAIVVSGNDGERIYLPPEEPDSSEVTPYQPATAYRETSDESLIEESPYRPAAAPDPPTGISQTATGFTVVHPSPTTQVELIRASEAAASTAS